MAERGVDESGENPFSFKTFVNVKEKKVTEKKDIFSDDEDDNIFAVPERKPSKKEKSKQDDKGNKKTKQKENPFSFKKFLAGSSSSNDTAGSSKGANSVPFPPPDVASDIHIPTLHDNHFAGENPASGLSSHSRNASKLSLFSEDLADKNDITDLTSNPSNISERIPANGSPFDLPLIGDPSERNVFQDDHASNSSKISGTLQLPDFLSDGPMHSSQHLTSKKAIPDADKRDQDLLQQIRILQDENSTLHNEVSRLKQKCSDKNQRLNELKNDMERLKKKEAEETAVMEKAVQQVEENLVTTTKRAVLAETTVSKLKQEVKSLQDQTKALTLENEAFRRGDGSLSDIRERTKYTADQLKSAAGTAERNLKELMLGVDQLRLLSQVLASWEKITDVSPDQETTPSSEDKPSS